MGNDELVLELQVGGQSLKPGSYRDELVIKPAKVSGGPVSDDVDDEEDEGDGE